MSVPEEPSLKLYPNCDNSVWMRTCEKELLEPKEAHVTGKIPEWVRGALIRNGPGALKVGDMTFQHLFDGHSLLHRFAIAAGKVTYQCRFLRSRTYERNNAANRIVMSEFGTQGVRDPCHSIFDRISAVFHPGEGMSDNAMISVYPFGDELYAFTEVPIVHRIDPATLQTIDRRDLSQSKLALVNHTSHPHVMPNGDVYNVGMTLSLGGINHIVVKFPHSEKGDMFSNAQIVAKVRPHRALNPSYMHTFGVTENYWVLVEQSLWLSMIQSAKATVQSKPLHTAMQFHTNKPTEIVLLSRSEGKEVARYQTDPLFFLHIINCYEDQRGDVVLDICAYKNANAINAMFIEAILDMQTNADYAEWFRARPVRLRLPSPTSAAKRKPLFVQQQTLADLGCETPRINYDLNNGRPYQYFYAISSDVDCDIPGSLIKVDVESGEVWLWGETGCYPSEPIFVPRPGGTSEDDGVVLSAMIWGAHRAKATGLLILDAKTWTEVARAELDTPSEAAKCLHGWFLPGNV